MQITTIPKTVIEKLQNCELSPSSHLSITERVHLYRYLLAEKSIIDDLTALKHIFKNPYNSAENEEKIVILIKCNYEFKEYLPKLNHNLEKLNTQEKTEEGVFLL